MAVGRLVLKQLSAITHLHYSRVEQAGFLVLKSHNIPSLLIEIGYISNLRQEKQLADIKYQKQIALAIAQGVKSIFDKGSKNEGAEMQESFVNVQLDNSKVPISVRYDETTTIAQFKERVIETLITDPKFKPYQYIKYNPEIIPETPKPEPAQDFAFNCMNGHGLSDPINQLAIQTYTSPGPIFLRINENKRNFPC